MIRDIDVDGSEFDWYERDDSGAARADGVDFRVWKRLPRSLPRKTVLVVAFLVPMIAASSFLFAGGAAAAVDFTAENVDASSHNGDILTLTAAPSGTITYEGFEYGASTVTVDLMVQQPDGTWTTIDSTNVTASGMAGTVSYDFSAISILDNSGWTKSDFEPIDGETKTTSLSIRVIATFHGVDVGQSDFTTSDTATFDVTVENVAVGGGVGGVGNTNGSGNADSLGSGA